MYKAAVVQARSSRGVQPGSLNDERNTYHDPAQTSREQSSRLTPPLLLWEGRWVLDQHTVPHPRRCQHPVVFRSHPTNRAVDYSPKKRVEERPLGSHLLLHVHFRVHKRIYIATSLRICACLNHIRKNTTHHTTPPHTTRHTLCRNGSEPGGTGSAPVRITHTTHNSDNSQRSHCSCARGRETLTKGRDKTGKW